VALAGLGLPAAPVLTGRAGEPRWPAGVSGSITHCAGYRACAVARTADVAALGIDAEPDAELPAGLLESVADRAERTWIARQAAAGSAVCWDRLLFSAKEAVAKAWYPLTGHWLGFGQLTVFPDSAGTFDARMAGSRLTGRWLARDGLIVTAVTWAGLVSRRRAWPPAGDQRSGNDCPRSASGRGPKMRRSASVMGTSLMLASRRIM
jgi:enterobactin synthetase component D / holo-[acyl-carrier protein] synthase